MNKHKSFHLSYFLILALILLLGVWFFYLYIGSPQKQFTVVIFSSLFYFTWGVAYHLLEGDFHAKIVVEYLLIAIIAVFLAKGAIFH